MNLSDYPTPCDRWIPRVPAWIQERAWAFILKKRAPEGIVVSDVQSLLSLPQLCLKIVCLMFIVLFIFSMTHLAKQPGGIDDGTLKIQATIGIFGFLLTAAIVWLTQTEKEVDRTANNALWRDYYRSTGRHWFGLGSCERYAYAVGLWAIERERIWNSAIKRQKLMGSISTRETRNEEERKL